MKVMQTIVNYIDFQSRIIELDMSWSDFKEYIYSHIYDGIYDDNIGVKKSYPIGKGLLINKVSWYKINQDDDCHLDFLFKSVGKLGYERVCFLILEE